MKIFLIFLIITFSACKKTENHSNDNLKEKQIIEIKPSIQKPTVSELYLKYINQLENMVKNDMPLDHSDGFKAVSFLSEISGYAGSGNQSYFGTIGFKEKDLRYWEAWYKNNKDTLNYVYQSKDTLGEENN